jgi:hypothetical protein
MIKFTADQGNGRTLLGIGLSFKNLKKFHDEAGDTYIRINGADMGLPVDILIFSGVTEQAMARQMADLIGPETQVNIDPRMTDG